MAKDDDGGRNWIESLNWPGLKNVLFRPDRYNYVKKVFPTTECVFCVAAQDAPKFENLVVHRSEYSLIVINKYPYNSGHLLVMPRAHIGGLLKLDTRQYTDLHECLRLALRAVEEVYEPQAVNIGMNHGKVAGAGIPEHLHYHLVPRWGGDTNFFPLIAGTKVVVENLDTSYARLKSWFSENLDEGTVTR
ncbi:MAG: HIT family hydrolase [Bdellovibrionales bacterium CG10_big_fil_rev_8_21_14_0_10_45_34]|nr:MAG: HIT family hydrolase [Bdellovibrionales bacterium CG10_big_fil_rev_8_21_14_0_10_45_34]